MEKETDRPSKNNTSSAFTNDGNIKKDPAEVLKLYSEAAEQG